jgi:glycine reductase
VHYLNQFYGGIGGEDFALTAPYKQDGPAGPGKLLEGTSGGAISVAGTVVCGDNKFVEDPAALDEIAALIKTYEPDGLVAGPAFLAGRYGEACAEICKRVKEYLGIPVITGLAPEHPSAERFKRDIPIVRTAANGADMKNAIPVMGKIIVKLIENEPLSNEDKQALIKRGVKENIVKEQNAAVRSIEMLLKKHRGEPFETEMPIPVNECVSPAPANMEMPLKIALVTDGGLMYKGNPERMPSGRCERFYEISIDGWDSLSPDKLDANHFGYDTRYVKDDPNRLLPLDVIRTFEEKNEVAVHPVIYATAGACTAMEHAANIGKGIAEKLKSAGIRAVILTST